MSEGVVIGWEKESGEIVKVPLRSRFQSTYVVGRPGYGKSNLLAQMIWGDLSLGHGLCLLDPKGTLFDLVACYAADSGRDDIILLDASDTLYPFGVNLFDCQDLSDPAARSRTVSHVLGLFEKVWEERYGSWGPQLEAMLRAVTTVMVDNPGMTVVEIPRMLYDDDFRAGLIENLRSETTWLWWEHEYNQMRDRERRDFRRSTINRVTALVDNEIVRGILGQSGTTVDIAAAMDAGMVILVKLLPEAIGDHAVSLIGSVIIREILQATMSRARTGIRTPFFLYADEYHRFAVPDFATLIEEAREFQVGVTIAHQRREQLDSRHRSFPLSATNLVCFQMIGGEAGEMALNFDATPPPRQIIGYRGIPRPVSRPYDVLKTGATPNEGVLKRFRTLEGVLEEMIDRATIDLGYMQREPHRFHTDYATHTHRYIEANTTILNAVNNRLYHLMMKHSAARTLDELHQETRWAFEAVFSHHLGAITDPEEAKREGDAWWAQGDNYLLWELCEAVTSLGLILSHTPIEELGGEQQPIYELEMSVSNVRDLIANEIAQLDVGIARVRLRGEEGIEEHVVRVKEAPACSGDIEELREASRRRYARPRRDVEEEIRTRGTLTPPVDVEELREEPAMRSLRIPRREPI